MKTLGVNRLSVGVQSLDPATLEFFERPHTPEQALAAVEAVRSAGFQRWSVDLIHGAPPENLATLQRNLLEILSLGPNHVSAYGLTYEPGTPLHARLERGAFEAQDEDDELANLAETRRTLEGAGLRAYEVSNFSTSGEECVHNLNYWKNGPYVGLGPSAASHVRGTRTGNARSLSRWRRAVLDRSAEPAWHETLDPLGRLGETWWLGLRLAEGVDLGGRRIIKKWDDASKDPALPVAQGLETQGHLERVGDRFRIPEASLAIADHIGKQFLALDA
jgi:oxygen-independent coproporphyrinogen-3 oxidase